MTSSSGGYATFDKTGLHQALSNPKPYTGLPWGPSEITCQISQTLNSKPSGPSKITCQISHFLFVAYPLSCVFCQLSCFVLFCSGSCPFVPNCDSRDDDTRKPFTDSVSIPLSVAVAMGTRISGSFMQTFPPEDS